MAHPSETGAAAPRRAGMILPLAAAVAAMICFQSGAAVAKSLFPAIGPQGTAALRLTLGAAMLLAATRPWRNWPRRAPLGPLIGLGVAMGLTILLFYMAVDRLPLGVATSLQFLGPLSVAVFSSRKPTDLIWAVLAAGGVWCLAGAGSAAVRLDPWGVAFALGAAAGWGAYILLGRAASATFGHATAALAVGISALVVLPVGVWHAGAALISPAILPMALAVAVLSAAAPFTLELYALARLPARAFATFTSLEPAFGVVSGLVLLNQRLSPLQIGGVALVISAAAGAAWSNADRRAIATPLPD
ncbi:MAG TPA: EamA family transporter [Caulobacteraceae bacterium]|nr:EamA family transporter [Caulobacteraceae bacterium]